MCHGSLDAMSKQAMPVAAENSVAVFAYGEASDNGGETKDLTGFDVIEPSVLLDVPGAICETIISHMLYVAVLRDGTAAADRSDSTVK